MAKATRQGLRGVRFRIAHNGYLSRLREGVLHYLQSLSKARRLLGLPLVSRTGMMNLRGGASLVG